MPEWVWNTAKEHDIGLRADDTMGWSYALCADTRDLLQEILNPAAREWSIFRVMRHFQMAIDMLNDAKRLAAETI